MNIENTPLNSKAVKPFPVEQIEKALAELKDIPIATLNGDPNLKSTLAHVLGVRTSVLTKLFDTMKNHPKDLAGIKELANTDLYTFFHGVATVAKEEGHISIGLSHGTKTEQLAHTLMARLKIQNPQLEKINAWKEKWGKGRTEEIKKAVKKAKTPKKQSDREA